MISNLELLPGSIETIGSPSELGIWNRLKSIFSQTTGMLSYRVLPLSQKDITDTPSFTLVTAEYGIIFIDVFSEKIISISDDVYWNLENDSQTYSRDASMEYVTDEAFSRLKKNTLTYNRQKKQFNVSINSVLIFTGNSASSFDDIDMLDSLASTPITSDDINKSLDDFINSIECSVITNEVIDTVFSIFEGTSSYRKVKNSSKELVSVNDFIQKSLDVTFKQDREQRQISLQLPSGPQRIRGLAGTGKTVVLALKAALTHMSSKNFKILYLFNTQSLYNQVTKLITDYYVPETGDIPEWSNLEILHAWGGRTKPGLYYNLCEKYGIAPLTYRDIRGTNSLESVYLDFLDKAGDRIKEEYDMVLIDEAQDFPSSVFELVYKITKSPKRIVWAYDEFQSLGNVRIRDPEDLFGKNKDNIPNILNSDLDGVYEGGIEKDFILPNCYRNPRTTLMVAHGVALGIYSKLGLVDSIDSVKDWASLGYKVLKPASRHTLREGDSIEVERPLEFSRNKLESLLVKAKVNSRNLLKYDTFENLDDQISRTASEIERLINNEGVTAEEIIVITLDTRNAEDHFATLRSQLNSAGINCITPGFIEKAAEFKSKGFVTLATPYRAKGNEGNVVFVINCQKTITDLNFKGRNSFFVALTRSRGWAHLYGTGTKMSELILEIDKILADYPVFKYVRPDDEFIQRRRVVLSKSNEELTTTNDKIDELLATNPEILIEQLKLRGFKIED